MNLIANGCVSLCVCPVTHLGPIQSTYHILAYDSRDGLQPTCDPETS